MADSKPRRKVTLNQLNKKMREGEQIVQMAIYDYRSAVIADRLGIDILCVSDTGGMILFGHLLLFDAFINFKRIFLDFFFKRGVIRL